MEALRKSQFMDKLTTGAIGVFTAIVGLAILAVLVSKSAATSGVISSITGGFANDIKAAVAPVSGFTGIGPGAQPLPGQN